MSNGLKKGVLVGLLVLFSLAVLGIIVFDFVLMAPAVTITYGKNIGQQKLDAEFKVLAEIESRSVLTREYFVNLDLKSGQEVKASLPPQVFRLKPRKKQTVEFVCMLSEPVTAGVYAASVIITAKKSIFSSAPSFIAEKDQEFTIAEKIINGIVNFIDIKGGRKVGEVLKINAVAKNTGEAEKPFSVDGEITNPRGESARLPVKEFNIKIEETKTFSYDYNIPLEAPAGKYAVVLYLSTGDAKDNSIKKLAEQQQLIEVAPRVLKVSLSVKVRGKLKSGETIGFDLDVKNSGDLEKLFSLETALVDASGKVIGLPDRELQLKVGETKKTDYDYSIPLKDSHGKYRLNIVAYAGSANDPVRKKITEVQQEFTVAERITKGSVVKLTASAQNRLKAGETIIFTADLKNTGEIDHVFPVALLVNNGKTAVKLNTKTLTLKTSESGQLTFEHPLPFEAPAGNYEVKASIYNTLDGSGNPLELYEEKTTVFAVGGATISGSAILTGTLGKFNYGDSLTLKAKFTNTGELRHTYFVKLEVFDPAKKLSTIFNDKVELEKGAFAEKTGQDV
ncbi:MAG: hypothetical protein WCK36_03395 [Candidatus Firestonebacteria bacterium]